MRNLVLIAILVLIPSFGFSQDAKEASVEESVFGVQIGLLGIWGHNELKLSNPIALRSEIGISGPNTANLSPMLALEPRWYYNLQRRVEKGRRIDGNSGNYFSLRTSYHFHDISENNNRGPDNLLIVPSWGIRRNIGKHFNYEAGIGVGLGVNYFSKTEIGLTTNVILKIGYRF